MQKSSKNEVKKVASSAASFGLESGPPSKVFLLSESKVENENSSLTELNFSTNSDTTSSSDEDLRKIYTGNHVHTQFKEGKEKKWDEPYYFVCGADIQFGFISSYFDNISESWEEEKELAKICVDKINGLRPRPRFFVICGDLCNAMPDEFPLLKRKQEKDFYEIFNKIDPSIPLVCVCGNHDVGNHPTIETVQSYRKSFGDDYFSFWVGGVHYLVINSQYYFDSSNVKEFFNKQEEWLDKQLTISSHLGPVIFQHIPWFLDDPESDDAGYFAIEKNIRKVMLEKLYKAGVRYVFCGHYHRNCIGYYKELESVVTTAIGGQLGDDKSGFRIVKVLKDKISHEYHSFENVPTNVTLE